MLQLILALAGTLAIGVRSQDADCEEVVACGVEVLCQCSHEAPVFRGCNKQINVAGSDLTHDIGFNFNNFGETNAVEVRESWIQRRSSGDEHDEEEHLDEEGCHLRNVRLPHNGASVASNAPGHMTALLKVIQSTISRLNENEAVGGSCQVVTEQCDGELEEMVHYVFFVKVSQPGFMDAILDAVVEKYTNDWEKPGYQPCARYEGSDTLLYCGL